MHRDEWSVMGSCGWAAKQRTGYALYGFGYEFKDVPRCVCFHAGVELC